MESIIFVHRGNAFYLSLALKQARKTNPTIEIILLGDDTNKYIEGVKHFFIKDYFNRAVLLDELFVNYSPNARNYELFCFQRWLVIWEFQEKHHEYRDKFVYCDTDTLLFDDVSKDLNQMGIHSLALEGEVGPAFAFFNIGTLGEFCDTIEWFYSTDEGKLYVKRFVENKKKDRAIHGFSDMYAFEYYVRKSKVEKIIDAQLDTRGWQITDSLKMNLEILKLPYFRYDQNVNFKEQFDLTKEGIKKFNFINGKPYAYNHELKENVLFKGIHFQGKAKYEMLKFCKEPIPFLSYNWIQYYIIYNLKKIKVWLKKH